MKFLWISGLGKTIKFDNKRKKDISKIKGYPPPRLINPPFNLLKLEHQGLK